jgi:hypothetical protein
MRTRRRLPRGWGVALALGLALGTTLPGWAQQAPPPKPVVAEAKILVTMGADGQDTVQATYTVLNVAGLKDATVDHALVRRPGAEVGAVEASGAATGAPATTQKGGISSVRVTVSGEPATYTLKYGVRRAAGTYAVPLLTPRIPVAKPLPNVTIETALPPGQKLDGEWFPSIDRTETRDGRTVVIHRVINIPSVTIAEYGRNVWLTPSLLITLVAVGFLLVVIVAWFRHAAAPVAAPTR